MIVGYRISIVRIYDKFYVTVTFVDYGNLIDKLKSGKVIYSYNVTKPAIVLPMLNAKDVVLSHSISDFGLTLSMFIPLPLKK